MTAICRNCGNTGIDMFGNPCVCSHGSTKREPATDFALPACEKCGKPATTSLDFSYRDEEYAIHFYCAPCCDIAWEEGVAYVDAKAAQLAAIQHPTE